MQIFDGHVHLDSNAAHLVSDTLRASGAEKWSVLSLSQLHDDPAQNPAMLLAKALAPENCFAFCGLDHPVHGRSVPDPLSQLQMWLDAGFDGLKLIETKPNCQKETGVRLDDARFEPMFAYCESHGIPILWHNGDPATFWDPESCPAFAVENGWSYLDGCFLSLPELYGIVERVLDRHPGLKVTFAHFYFVSDDPDHAQKMMERYPNVRFDLTPGSEMYEGFTRDPGAFRPFFLRWADRIQLGTDTHVTASPHGVSEGDARYSSMTTENILRFLTTDDAFEAWGLPIRGYDLPPETVRQIVAGTLTSFVGSRPAPLSRDASLRACRASEALCGPEGALLVRQLTEELLSRI